MKNLKLSQKWNPVAINEGKTALGTWEFALHAASCLVFENNEGWAMGCCGWCWFVCGFFLRCMHTHKFLPCPPSLFPPTSFPSPALPKKSRNAMPLVFTNMHLPHVEHLCAGFGMLRVAILAEKIQNLWEMPYSSGNGYRIIY